VPHLQRAWPKRHYSVTRVDEEFKAIFIKRVFRTRLKPFYRWRHKQFLVENSRGSDQQPRTIVCRASSLFEESGSQCQLMNGDIDVRVIIERDDDIAKVGRTLIGMNEEHRVIHGVCLCLFTQSQSCSSSSVALLGQATWHIIQCFWGQ